MLMMENSFLFLLLSILLPLQVICEDTEPGQRKIDSDSQAQFKTVQKPTTWKNVAPEVEENINMRSRRNTNFNPYLVENVDLEKMNQIIRLLSLLTIKGRENEAWVDDIEDPESSIEIITGKLLKNADSLRQYNNEGIKEDDDYYGEPIEIHSHRPLKRLPGKRIWKFGPKPNGKYFKSRQSFVNQNNNHGIYPNREYFK